MKKYIVPPFIVTLGFFIVSSLWLRAAAELPIASTVTSIGGPGTFPIIILAFMVAISFILMVTEFQKAKKGRNTDSAISKNDLIRVLFLIVAAIAYVVVIDYIGYLPATVILLGLSLLIFGVTNKIAFVAVTALFPTAIWILFQMLLKVQLP